MEAQMSDPRAAPPPLIRVLKAPKAFELILEHLDFHSVNRLRQTNRFLWRKIDRNPPDIRLNMIVCELGRREISLLLQRNPDFNSENDPFDADIKYIQEDNNCVVKKNGVVKRVLKDSDIYKVAIKDLILALTAQASVLYRFVITCENSLAEEYMDNLRTFHRLLHISLEYRHRPLPLLMLQLSIPPDEEFVMPVFSNVDPRFISTLQIDNNDATKEDTTLELRHTLNTRQWANLDFLCVNQGFRLLIPFARLAEIPRKRVLLHARVIAQLREWLAWNYDNGLLRPEHAMQR